MDIVEGPKLWWIVASLCVGLLLSSLESTIVSTALVSISTDFNNYRQSSWIIIVYLLTYSSCLFVFARLSDITGRKAAVLTSLCCFTAASLACGLARTMTQLIVFRAFQGIGGSGVYSLTMVLVSEITPKQHLGAISGMVNMVFVIASAIGPVVGGAITTYSSWRWCFYLNVPSGVLVITLICFMFPKLEGQAPLTMKAMVRRVDWLGLALCLGASIILIIPIQEGGGQWAWSSTLFIVMMVAGGACWVAFALWEYWLSSKTGELMLLPMLPKHVIVHRIVGACTVSSFFTGFAFTSIVVYLPQRFQATNGLSPVKSGVEILPVLLVSAFGATAAGILCSKRNICSYLIIAGSILQVIGLGLLSALPTSAPIPTDSFGYQAVLGLGLGTLLSASFVLARIEVRREDIAPTVGFISQVRVFGGVIGVVIGRVVQSGYLSKYLAQILTPDETSALMSSLAAIEGLPPHIADAVRKVYGSSFNWQFRIFTYIAIANVFSAILTFRRNPTSIEKAIERDEEARASRPAGTGPTVVLEPVRKSTSANAERTTQDAP